MYWSCMFKIIHFYMATIPTDIALKSHKSCTECDKTSVIDTSNQQTNTWQNQMYPLLMCQQAYLCKQTILVFVTWKLVISKWFTILSFNIRQTTCKTFFCTLVYITHKSDKLAIFSSQRRFEVWGHHLSI